MCRKLNWDSHPTFINEKADFFVLDPSLDISTQTVNFICCAVFFWHHEFLQYLLFAKNENFHIVPLRQGVGYSLYCSKRASAPSCHTHIIIRYGVSLSSTILSNSLWIFAWRRIVLPDMIDNLWLVGKLIFTWAVSTKVAVICYPWLEYCLLL